MSLHCWQFNEMATLMKRRSGNLSGCFVQIGKEGSLCWTSSNLSTPVRFKCRRPFGLLWKGKLLTHPPIASLPSNVSVYKELRLLRASVSNSSKLDRALERVINVFFYILLLFVVLAVFGHDPFYLFGYVTGFLLAFAFMIGTACSKYVEGLLRTYN